MPPARRPARPTRPPKRGGRALTPPEGLLWEMLRDGRLNGLAFARRHPHRRFVLDFFSPDVGVAVLLVGAGAPDADARSADERARKLERDAQALEAEGLVVLRVPEARVMTDLPGVLAEIARAAAGRRGTWAAARS